MKGGASSAGRVGGLDGRVQLRGQHQQLAPRLDDDAPHVAAGGGDDFDRLAFGRLTHFVAHPHQLVGLGQPGTALLTVLIEQSRARGRDRPWRVSTGLDRPRLRKRLPENEIARKPNLLLGWG